MEPHYPDFLSQNRPQTLVVYGNITSPETIAGNLGRRTDLRPDELTNRYALVSPNSPGLRLSSPGWIDIPYGELSQFGSGAELFDHCRDRLVSRISPFSKLIRLSIDRYLNFASAQLETHKAEVPGGTASDEIFDYSDWIFSAWLALPQAQILLPAAFSEDGPAFAELDIAFCLPGKLIGVMIEGAGTPIGSRQKKLDYVIENHPQFELVKIPKAGLLDGGFPIELFPRSVARFWQGLKLPQGPCIPEVLLESPAG